MFLDLQVILLGFASQLITCRNEMAQFPITYYFHEDETETALAGILPYLAEIAEEEDQSRDRSEPIATLQQRKVDLASNLRGSDVRWTRKRCFR